VQIELFLNRNHWRSFVPNICSFMYKSCQLNSHKQIEDFCLCLNRMLLRNEDSEVTQVEALLINTDLNITFRLRKANNADSNKQIIIRVPPVN
jgi:hypothetical protein